MRLSLIRDGFVGSLSYALLNRARGTSGYVFQIYSLVWIMWLAFFVIGMLHPLASTIGLRAIAFSLIPSGIQSIYPQGIAASVVVLLSVLPIFVLLPYMPVYAFWAYENRSGIMKRRLRGAQAAEELTLDCRIPASVEAGFPHALSFRVNNPNGPDLENVWIRWVFPGSLRCDSPQVRLGALARRSAGYASMNFVPLHTGKISMGTMDLYFEIRGQKYTKSNIPVGLCSVVCSCLSVSTAHPEYMQFGKEADIAIYVANRTSIILEDVQIKCSFHQGIESDAMPLSAGAMQAGCGYTLGLKIVPKTVGSISIGYLYIDFRLNGNICRAGPAEMGVCRIFAPELSIKVNVPDTLYKGIPAAIGLMVENQSEELLSGISLSSCFSSQIECEIPTVSIDRLLPSSSRYISLAIRPVSSGRVDFGNLNVSFEVNGIPCRKEPVVLGVHKIN